MVRLARLALALFLVPVVIFTAPTTAAAAAGPWKNATVKAINPVTGSLDVTCQLTLRQSGVAEIPGIELGANGYCVGGPDITPGGTQAGESGANYVISVDGLTATGAPCNGSRAGTLGPHPANGTVRVAGSFQGGFINIATPCSIQRIGVRFDGTNQDQFTWQGVDVPALEATPAPVSACIHGTPYVFMSQENRYPGSDIWAWDETYLNFSLPGAPPSVSTARWGAVVYFYGVGGATQIEITGQSKILVRSRQRYYQDPPRAMETPVRVQIYAYPSSDGTNWNGAPPNDARAAASPDTFPVGQNSPYFGMTDPAHCRFYFGPKQVTDPTSEMDEPHGDGLNPNAPVAPDEPEPVVDQPVPVDETGIDFSWLWAILEAVRRALSAVADAIAALAGAILNGLKALFIPDRDAWGADELVQQLEQKPPFSLLGELEDESRAMGQAYRSGGGCGVIADFGNGGVISCATIANVPGYPALYSLVSAGLMGLTGWSMFLMVSRVFEQGQ